MLLIFGRNNYFLSYSKLNIKKQINLAGLENVINIKIMMLYAF